MNPKRTGFACAMLLASSVVHAAGFSFAPYVVYPTDPLWHSPSAASGDVTGDGRDDLVVVSDSSLHSWPGHDLLIFVQGPQGTFASPLRAQHTPFANGNALPSVAVGDLDHDGTADIVLGVTNSIAIWRRGTPGEYFIYWDVTGSAGPVGSPTLGDVDGDGHLDVAIVRNIYEEQDVLVYFGDGKGGLHPSPLVIDIPQRSGMPTLAIRDMNGDGKPDLITNHDGAIVVYVNDGARHLVAGLAIAVPQGPSSIGDFTEDGRNDIVVAESASNPSGKLYLYPQAANGSFSTARVISSLAKPQALAAVDLDQDGRTDVIAAHGGLALVGVRLAKSDGFGTEITGAIPPVQQYAPDAVVVADFTGDGCPDTTVSAMETGVVLSRGVKCYEPWSMSNRHDGDFDGDGRADILWHNGSTGAGTIWRSGNSAYQIPFTQVTDTRWTIAGIGDFNGDGRSDVLWRHTFTGANVLWFSGDSSAAISLKGVSDPHWRVVGIGDFDGNAQDDILWRHRYTGANAIWKEGLHARAQNLTTITDQDWIVVGVGDFDGNGKADILWRHRSNGRNTIWRDANSAILQTMTTVPDLGWQVAGLGDFNQDRRADILWRHAYDGRTVIWHAGSATQSRTLTQVTDLTWKIAGVGDYDGNGRSDVLWRRSNTGANAIWRAADYADPQPVSGVTNMQWGIVR
jgi:hypothetical protein